MEFMAIVDAKARAPSGLRRWSASMRMAILAWRPATSTSSWPGLITSLHAQR